MPRKPRPIRRRTALALTALMAGCAAPPWTAPGAPGQPAPPISAPPAPAAPSLADEHRRLRELLNGTPVAVEMSADGRLRVEVPLRNSFDAGRAAVKAPLAAVLDRMASGLRQRQSTELRIAAPSDPGGSSMLAADRAASTRDYLVARGVSALRFVSVGHGDRDGVLEVVVSERFTPPAAR